MRDKPERKVLFCWQNFTNYHFYYCLTNLLFLCETATEIIADGTFYVCPPFFYQLYTIRGYVNGHYIQAAFCLLPNKRQETYVNMWLFLQSLCEGKLNPASILLDYEIAAHQAFWTVFPNSRIRGCRFHIGQCWFRNICQLGLKKDYEGTGVISDWLKLFFGLPFFEASAVLDAFCEIMGCNPPDSRCIAFCDYVQDTFILVCAFPPEM